MARPWAVPGPAPSFAEPVYVELSVRHLVRTGSLPSAPQVGAFVRHPDRTRISQDWLAHESPRPAARELFDLECRLFRTWQELRGNWLAAYLSDLGLPHGVRDAVVETLRVAEDDLAGQVARARSLYRLRSVLRPERLDVVAHLRFAADIAHLACAEDEQQDPNRADGTARFLRDEGFGRHDARAALPFLRKLTAAAEDWLAGASDVTHHDIPQPELNWTLLWRGLGERVPERILDLELELFCELAPALVSDAELRSDRRRRFESTVRALRAEGMRQRSEREAEALRRLRAAGARELPMTDPVIRAIVRIVETWFANFGPRLAPEAVREAIRRRL